MIFKIDNKYNIQTWLIVSTYNLGINNSLTIDILTEICNVKN